VVTQRMLERRGVVTMLQAVRPSIPGARIGALRALAVPDPSPSCSAFGSAPLSAHHLCPTMTSSCWAAVVRGAPTWLDETGMLSLVEMTEESTPAYGEAGGSLAPRRGTVSKTGGMTGETSSLAVRADPGQAPGR
jgi:hypothetical protein